MMSVQFARYRPWLLAIFLVPALACGFLGDAPPTESPTAAPSSTPPPATATTTQQETFVDYELPDQGLSFRYPQSWEVEANGNSVVVASDSELLTSQEFDREGAGVLLVVGPADTFEGNSLEEALLSAIEDIAFTTNDNIVEGPTLTTINGQEAVRATIEGSSTGGNQTLVVFVTLVREAERALFVSAVTLQSVRGQYVDTLETLVQSVVVEPLGTVEASAPQGSLVYGETVEGTITAGDIASWTFIGVEGEHIDVTVRPLDENLDVTVDVRDRQGASILPGGPVDDSFGAETIRGLTLPSNAQYTVVVSGFEQSNGAFELAIAEAGALTSAQSIALGDTLNGALELDEQDDYLFRSTQQEPVTVVLNPVDDLDVVLEILDGEGGIIFQEDSSYGQEQLSFTPDEGSDYILRVRGYAGAAGEYSINLAAGGVGSTGTTLIVSYSLDEGDTDGDDFPFVVDQGETARAIVDPEGEFDVVVEIWNDDTDAVVETVDASFGREEVNFTATDAGNYFFRVLGFEGQGGDYTITLNGPPEVIFELIAGDRVNGDLGQSTFIDYHVRLQSGETIQIDVQTDADTDIVAALFDLEGNQLAGADEGFTGETEQLSFTAPPADGEGNVYRLRISNFSGDAGGTFTLSLDS